LEIYIKNELIARSKNKDKKMQKIDGKRILITGSSGMVGSAMKRYLQRRQVELLIPSHAELDLRDQTRVNDYFAQYKPELVFHLAAIVGGIHANNTYPGKFLYDNTQMHLNVIQAAHQSGVEKVLFPGSACTYPKLASQPMHESAFLDGKIEPTNIAYAAAKINGIVMAQSYAKQYGMNIIVPMPTNAYGIGDNFDPNASHVIPALMKRFHEAKMKGTAEETLWGTGQPLREFIYVDDLADALLFLMENYHSPDIINVGTMQEITIADLAQTIANVVGYKGQLKLDTSKPDGAPRKCLDSTKLQTMGWKPRTGLQQGLDLMYQYHFQTSDKKAACC